MKWRLGILLLLLVLHIFFNLASVGQYRMGEPVKVWFDHYKILRSVSECTITNGTFWAKNKELCYLSEDETVLVSGRLSASLIDRLMGRIWLDQPSHYIADIKNNQSNNVWMALGDKVNFLRSKLVESTLAWLPSPEGELVLGIVMGYKSVLPRQFYDQLVRSGTVHIVVASGYNVMVVAGLVLSGALLF